MLYTAKCYWPGITTPDLDQIAGRTADTGLNTGTGPVTYLGSFPFAHDDLVPCLFCGPPGPRTSQPGHPYRPGVPYRTARPAGAAGRSHQDHVMARQTMWQRARAVLVHTAVASGINHSWPGCRAAGSRSESKATACPAEFRHFPVV